MESLETNACAKDDPIACECQTKDSMDVKSIMIDSVKELRILVPETVAIETEVIKTWGTFLRRLFAWPSLRGSMPLACTSASAVPVSTE